MTAARPRLMLVGAGHTHVEVLRRWAQAPVAADVMVLTDHEASTYSGMVPGVVAGDYRLEQSRIPVRPLAERAGASVVVEAARRIDPVRRVVELWGGGEISFDLASLDVGSSVRGLEVPGVREHTVATRPIDAFATRVESRIDEVAGRRSQNGDSPEAATARLQVAVVGGGAAGAEVAFVMRARLASRGVPADIVLVCGKEGLLAGYAPRVAGAVRREAAALGIGIDASSDVTRIDADGILLAAERRAADLVVWATGPAAPAVIRDSALPHDEHGFVRVRATLEVCGIDGLFAVGDCATIDGKEWVPRAGVHAVREAPVLDRNLRAAITGSALRKYEPQRDFLSLFNLGEQRALATKWGLVATGHLAWLLKDRIDRGFVTRLQAPADQRR